MDILSIPNDTFVVKITGRYIIEDVCPFFQTVENLADNIDAIAKFGFGTPTACNTGLIGLRCGYIKQIKMPGHYVSVEENWGEKIRSLPQNKVIILPILGIKTCPNSHTYDIV